MLHRKTTYQSPVFTDFETLGKRNYHEIVHFCERNRDAMNQLNFDEFFIMELAYCHSLFQMDMFEKHIKTANHVIKLSILNNVQFYEGEDIYHRTLFQKAQAHKALNELPEAIHITKELLKMNTVPKEYQQFLKLCFTKDGTPFLQNLRAYGVLIIFFAAGLLVLNILIIEPFFPMKVGLFNMISVSSLVVGGLALIGGLTIHHWEAKRKFDEFMRTLKR